MWNSLPKTITKLHHTKYYFASNLYYPDKFDLKSSGTSFKASDLQITRTTTPLPHPPADPNIMKFGTFHTDHLLEIDWTEEQGWQKPQIVPFKYFQIHPFSSCLHYAIQCFEGSKAYKNEKGELRWFRGESNMFRMKKSAHRLGLPDFDGDEYMGCIKALLDIDRAWIPQKQGFSAYIRPTFIAMEETLGVRAPTKAKLYACISPVGPYFPTGLKPIKVYCNTHHVRASLGGVGEYKVGGNYAPTIQPNKFIETLGFNQSLWMLSNGLIQEMGVCNLFIFMKNKNGENELITPILDGTILPGITRDSILRMATEMDRFKVIQRSIHIDEVIQGIKEGRVLDVFGCGTAVNVQPISTLGYKEEVFELKINPEKNAGDLTHELNQKLTDIQTNTFSHPWIQTI